MGNAASPFKPVMSSSDDVIGTTSTKTTVRVSRPCTPVEDRQKIFQEFPELEDTISYVGVLVKSIYNHRDSDATKKVMNLSTKKSLDELYNFYFEYDNSLHRQWIGDELATAGAALVFVDYMKILTNDGDEYPMEGYKYECFEILRGVCWNFTDVSQKLCEEFGRMGMLPLMLHDLQKFQHTFHSNPKQNFIVLSAMSVLHNCACWSDNMKYYKAMNAVDTVAWYVQKAKNATDVLAPLSILTLAYIVDEENNDIIQTDNSIIETILKLLAEALTTSDHRCDGFSAEELTKGLTRLASNADNSVVIVENGFLKSVIIMLKGERMAERIVAGKAVWVLSFEEKNKRAIKEENEIMELLQIYSTSRESVKLNQTANGALWVLDLNQADTKTVKLSKLKKKRIVTSTLPEPAPLESKDNSGKYSEVAKKQPTPRGHVMVSYQWDCQKLMTRIKRLLETDGYRVWMDVDEMGGSTLQSMADGVENSAVILICMSQKYKDSPSCRTEAEYAYKLDKTVIPLRIETDYKPDGWLGAILGAKYYFDFSNLMNFDRMVSNLIKEMGDKGKQGGNIVPVERNRLRAQPKGKTTKDWNENDVRNWARENAINNLKARSLDGNVLLFLKKLKHEAPEFFYRYVTEQLGLKNIKDVMKLSNAIVELV